jgi:rRNA methylase, putative, group 3
MGYIFGIRPILEAIETNKGIEKVMVRQGSDGPQFHRLLDKLRERGIPAQFVPIQRLDSMTRSNHQGVIAIVSTIEYASVESMIEAALKKEEAPLFLMLDGVSDVRNFGAIARTAECAGVDGIVLPAKGGASINADAIKTSAGALLRIPVAKVQNLREAIFQFQQADINIVSATEKATETIYETDLKKGVAIVMGSEEKGISKSILALSSAQAKIPMPGTISSLNVSIATAIVLFEAVRQRG